MNRYISKSSTYYRPTIHRAEAAVVSTFTRNNDNENNNKIKIIIIIIIFPFVYLDCTYARCVARIFLRERGGGRSAHTVSSLGFLPDWHDDIHAVLY